MSVVTPLNVPETVTDNVIVYVLITDFVFTINVSDAVDV